MYNPAANALNDERERVTARRRQAASLFKQKHDSAVQNLKAWKTANQPQSKLTEAKDYGIDSVTAGMALRSIAKSSNIGASVAGAVKSGVGKALGGTLGGVRGAAGKLHDLVKPLQTWKDAPDAPDPKYNTVQQVARWWV